MELVEIQIMTATEEDIASCAWHNTLGEHMAYIEGCTDGLKYARDQTRIDPNAVLGMLLSEFGNDNPQKEDDDASDNSGQEASG